MSEYIKPFTQELEFEKSLAQLLTKHGWQPVIIINPSEKDLIENWKHIIYNHNRGINELGDFPLTDTEMQQIINQINQLGSPYKINQLLLGKHIPIKRDNSDDHVNKGKTVYLKLFDPHEIRTGQSEYQIVRQPRFETTHPLASTRRGDLMLLINGMPLIHIELKRSGVDITQAVNQIKKYTAEGVFSKGIYSLVQIFVAMTPEETKYFANPGKKENFNKEFQFHWADFNNKEMKDWQQIAANLLCIPMAHQMVGYYTIADDKDETLKVLRPYQYHATTALCDKVRETNWDNHAHRGGYIWHTTGSGKTMTSFKSAQLVADAKDADKVVFLLDRIELSTQSADEYKGFANADDNVLETEDTASLISALENDDPNINKIVTSIQKMSRVNNKHGVPQSTLDHINKKRLVFIVDECHRGVFGNMLMDIKNAFPRALLFGFTGTPVMEENSKSEITTGTIFGDNLHKYTLANGIPDGNVLGFDLTRVDTFKEDEIRRMVALKAAGVESEDQLDKEPEKQKIFNTIMNDTDMLKIEDMAKSLYSGEEHHKAVMHKIMEEWDVVSRNGLFHGMLATKNIPEAIEYYQLFKEFYPDFNVVAVFDDNIDNEDRAIYKETAILEMLEDYNKRFGTSFQQSTYAKYKKDVAKRLAHKGPYRRVEKSKQINLLIVVTQMLTGYDSKYVNALYVDKVPNYINIIQSFSRTNRLYGPEKPHGIIKFFTQPRRMQENIKNALELYVDQPLMVFVDKLESNLEKINKSFEVIKQIFEAEGIRDFERLPDSDISKKKFAKEFCDMTKKLEAAKMQGFSWEKKTYEFPHTNGYVTLTVNLDEETYVILRQRYKELFEKRTGGDPGDDDVYQLESYITETGLGTIDADYINSKFIKYVKYLYTDGVDSVIVKQMLQELHHVFATLSQRDQRTAQIIIHEIQRGNLRLSPDKTIYDYIKEYQRKESDHQVYALSEITGLDAQKLTVLVNDDVNEQNLNERGRFNDLMLTFNKDKMAEFLKKVTGKEVKKMFLTSNASALIRKFILEPDTRSKILYAYQHEDSIFDPNGANQEEIPEETQQEDELETKPAVEESNKLTDEEKRKNVANLVRGNLRGVRGWPGTDKVVDSFFKIINIQTLPSQNGLAFDFYKVFDELFARKEVNYVDKHVDLTTLLIRFEVYLKKLYYLIKGSEIRPRPGSEKTEAMLADAIHSFECLWSLRSMPGEKYRNLESYLSHLREWRNTESGSGAHASIFLTDEELDRRIKEVVTLYMYVTGSVLEKLEDKIEL